MPAFPVSHRLEMGQTPVFWNFTLNAHLESVIFRLVRLYDQEKSGLKLKRFLLTVKTNLEYFSEQAIQERLPADLSLLSRKMNPATLGNDIRRVSEDRDPLVCRLWKLRNGSISHMSPNPVRLGNRSTQLGLKPKEIETLLNRARAIVTRYSLIYRASWLSGKIVGADDYLHLLDLVSRGRMSLTAEHEQEMRRWRTPLSPRISVRH
jgi:hypothetical protein